MLVSYNHHKYYKQWSFNASGGESQYSIYTDTTSGMLQDALRKMTSTNDLLVLKGRIPTEVHLGLQKATLDYILAPGGHFDKNIRAQIKPEGKVALWVAVNTLGLVPHNANKQHLRHLFGPSGSNDISMRFLVQPRFELSLLFRQVNR